MTYQCTTKCQLERDKPLTRIREFNQDRDLEAVRRCLIELQDFERGLDSRAPKRSDIADDYMRFMLEHCQKYLGKIFVAEIAGSVVGHVSIWARVEHDEPDAVPKEYGFVSDLVVLGQYRSRGIGRKLLARAEAYAQDCNVQ